LVEEYQTQDYGTLIFVNPPKVSMAPMAKMIGFLQKYSPWTPYTFPDIPAAMKGLITYKKVTVSDEETRNKLLLRNKYKWSREMFSVGLKPQKVRKAKAKNLVAEGVSKEFGYGQNALPHWAPALRRIARDYGVILRKRKNKDMLSNPKNSAWKTPQERNYKELSYNEVLQYKAFMTQLARKL